jgi:hypothetical protein
MEWPALANIYKADNRENKDFYLYMKVRVRKWLKPARTSGQLE